MFSPFTFKYLGHLVLGSVFRSRLFRRDGKGRRRRKGRKEEGEGSKEQEKEGKSISLYILPPPDRPHLRQVLVILMINDLAGGAAPRTPRDFDRILATPKC